MSRLRSASECSLESDLSDTDSYTRPGHSTSDTESDIEMEVRNIHIPIMTIVPCNIRAILTCVTQGSDLVGHGWRFESHSLLS